MKTTKNVRENDGKNVGEACNGVKKKKHKYSRTFSESEKLREGIL